MSEPDVSALSMTGTLTLRKVGPVRHDSATGRPYTPLAGTATYQMCSSFDGQPSCSTDTAAVGLYSDARTVLLDSTGHVFYDSRLGTYVDDAGQFHLDIGSKLGFEIPLFSAVLAPSAGRLAGAATYYAYIPGTHGSGYLPEPGAMTADRVP